jgi:hypothetical protein
VKAIGDFADANSQVVGILIMVAIMVILALLILLMLRLPALSWEDPVPPRIIAISAIRHYDEAGTDLNYDSRIILVHTGISRYENDRLRAEIYVNDNLAPCRIETMHGHSFIPTHHTGVERMWGYGCQTDWWNPGEKTGLDLTDGTIRPGDRVRVDIIETVRGRVVSRDLVTA